MHKSPKLLIFSGPPAVGKTTISKEVSKLLKVANFSRDCIHSVLYSNGLVSASTADSYDILFSLAEYNLALGLSCIIDAVFPDQEFRNKAKIISENHGACLYPIHLQCSCREALYNRRKVKYMHRDSCYENIDFSHYKNADQRYQEWVGLTPLVVDTTCSMNECIDKILHYIGENHVF